MNSTDAGKAMRRALIAAMAAAMLVGCAGRQPSAVPTYKVGDNTVYVDAVHTASMPFPTLQAYADATPVIVVGTVVATNTIAAEVQPSIDDEGVAPGEGPDLYGTITFKITELLKGRTGGAELRIVYESGKRDGRNLKQRIAYTHEALRPFQLDNGNLRASADLAGQEFVIFAQPNRRHPVFKTDHVVFHHLGIARVTPTGLVFPDPHVGPVRAGPNAPPAQFSLADVRAAARAAQPA